MTINVDAEREAVARMLYRWNCEDQADWDGEWREDYWDDLQIDSERDEWRNKAMLLIDSIVGTLTEHDCDLCSDADHKRRVAERDMHTALLALGEATGVIEGLIDQQAMPDDWYAEKLAYFRALVTSQPGHDARCTALAHHPECPDWRLPI